MINVSERLKEVDEIKYKGVYVVRHGERDIFETTEKVREFFGECSNIVVIEKQTFEVVSGGLKIEAAVKLIMKDYIDERFVSLVKILTEDSIPVLIISDMMTYQSHAPF